MTSSKALIYVCIFALSLTTLSCMSVRNAEKISTTSLSKEQFTGRKIAVLPVKPQASIMTDSILSLNRAINDRLAPQLRAKIDTAEIKDSKTSIDVLNENNKIEALDKLFAMYDSTGVFDKKLIASLANTLSSNYIVISRLRSEKQDMSFLAKGLAATLEVMIIDASKNQIVWAGSGEFKRGGIFGFGSTEATRLPEELVTLALSTL